MVNSMHDVLSIVVSGGSPHGEACKVGKDPFEAHRDMFLRILESARDYYDNK
jgi:hypothetical protein